MNFPRKPKRTSRCSSPLSASRLWIVALCLMPAFAQAQAGLGLPKWMQREIVDRIRISGYRRLSYHNHTVSGDSQAFDLGNYGGQGEKHFTDFGNVRVTGDRVLGGLNFDFVIQDSRFQDPQGQHFSVNYETGPWRADLGDIRGSLLNTNRFALFTKTLRGVSLGYASGPFAVKTVYSDVRGAPRTVTFNGTNTAGPYYLQSAQIVRGSETVEVDGVRQVLGQDYTINYEIGSITFVNRATLEAKIIPPTSTIVATYEVFGFSGSSGRLEAAGASYKFGPYGSLGLTAMQQLVGGSGGLSTRLEKFQGFGPPSTPYFLQFTPLASQPIVIRVNGILQVDGVDYFFDADNPSIFFFNRFMPATDEIDVLYTPTPTSTVQGDRQTLGWDYRLPLGKAGLAGAVTYSEATGRLMNTPTPSSGTARGVDLRYGWSGSSILASWRDVPSGYVNVESVGFNRNERALDLRYTLRSSSTLDYSLGYNNSSISSSVVDTGGNTLVSNNRFTKLDGSVKYHPEGGGLPLDLTHTRTKSHNPQGETDVASTDLGTSKGGKVWNARLGLTHT
ncbi:MAG TPA: hypothetical protein VNI20_01225, partial [Fimbriimonadaceae bacterium]|nr:hypothetical protein [Fimbriimonadaceae bacterium]